MKAQKYDMRNHLTYKLLACRKELCTNDGILESENGDKLIWWTVPNSREGEGEGIRKKSEVKKQI